MQRYKGGVNPLQLFDPASCTYTCASYDEARRDALIIDPVEMETVVWPAHDCNGRPDSTIGAEKQPNARVADKDAGRIQDDHG